MKYLLLSFIVLSGLHTRAQVIPKISSTTLDSLQRLYGVQESKPGRVGPATFSHPLPGGTGSVYVLPLDGMPCVIPEKEVSSMPVLKSLPGKEDELTIIPNPGLGKEVPMINPNSQPHMRVLPPVKLKDRKITPGAGLRKIERNQASH